MADGTPIHTADTWWQQISPLLDEALELQGEARAHWLTQLRRRDPSSADSLVQLLAEHERLTSGQFLGEAVAPAMQAPASAGMQVGAYRLTAPVGQGGMGTVWLAQRADGRFEGRAAVKLLDVARLARGTDAGFFREGSLLAQLQHPNIAHLIDAGIAPNGQPYLLLEYVEGARIDAYCETHALNIEARVRLFLDVLAAVAHAHTRLVVHCDLKPANILVTEQGLVKLLDFGIASLLKTSRGEPRDALAVDDARGMTPQYAAPEQLRGEAVSTSTDVYALGMVLFVLLAGRHPLELLGSSMTEVLSSAGAQTVPTVSSLAATAQRKRALQGDLDAIVAKALQPNADERYISVDAFAQDLRRFLTVQPVAAHPDTLSYRTSKFMRRNRGSVLTAAITTLALLATTSFAVVQLLEARKQRDEAQAQTQRAEGFNDVITSILSQGGPGGRALSAEELLDRAAIEMQHKYKDDPRTLVNMLIRIAGRYYDLRKTHKEYSMELMAEAVARRAPDRSLLLYVECNTVETEVNLGRMQAATQRMRGAKALLNSLTNVPPGTRVDCLRNAAELEWQTGTHVQAKRDMDEGLATLRAIGETSENRYAGLLSMRAALEENPQESLRLTLELVQLHERFGRGDSIAGFLSNASLARAHYQLGNPRKARALLEKIAPELTVTPMGTPPVVLVMGAYGVYLARLGETARAKIALQRVIGASTPLSTDRNLRLRPTIALGRILVSEGDLQSAAVHLQHAREIMSANPRADEALFFGIARLAIELDLAQGRVADAQREVDAEFARVRNIALSENPYIGGMWLLRARVQLAQHEPVGAITSAREAVRAYSVNTLDPKESADVGEAQLVLAQVLAANNDAAGAAQTARVARATLTRGLGESHALTRAAAALAVAARR